MSVFCINQTFPHFSPHPPSALSTRHVLAQVSTPPQRRRSLRTIITGHLGVPEHMGSSLGRQVWHGTLALEQPHSHVAQWKPGRRVGAAQEQGSLPQHAPSSLPPPRTCLRPSLAFWAAPRAAAPPPALRRIGGAAASAHSCQANASFRRQGKTEESERQNPPSRGRAAPAMVRRGLRHDLVGASCWRRRVRVGRLKASTGLGLMASSGRARSRSSWMGASHPRPQPHHWRPLLRPAKGCTHAPTWIASTAQVVKSSTSGALFWS